MYMIFIKLYVYFFYVNIVRMMLNNILNVVNVLIKVYYICFLLYVLAVVGRIVLGLTILLYILLGISEQILIFTIQVWVFWVMLQCLVSVCINYRQAYEHISEDLLAIFQKIILHFASSFIIKFEILLNLKKSIHLSYDDSKGVEIKFGKINPCPIYIHLK